MAEVTLYTGDIKDVVEEVLYLNPNKKLVVVHGCNCFNNMGAGLAKRIKQLYPIAFEVDNETKKGDYSKLGKYTLGKVNTRLSIANVYSQYKYGRGVHLVPVALKDSLDKLLEDMYIEDTIFLVPKYIGCGHAGGDLSVTKPILQEFASKANLILFEN